MFIGCTAYIVLAFTFAAVQGALASDGPLSAVGTTATVPPPPYFRASDFKIGTTIEFAHCPGQLFKLVDADEFTKAHLSDRAIDTIVPAALAGKLTGDEFIAFRRLAELLRVGIALFTMLF